MGEGGWEGETAGSKGLDKKEAVKEEGHKGGGWGSG